MRSSFWSDENRWFVRRTLGVGYSLNLKYVARRLGWITSRMPSAIDPESTAERPSATPKTRVERLRERIESSKHEDTR